MTEQEAKALASEFMYHKSWQPIGIDHTTFQGLPEQWGVLLSHRTLVSCLYVDNADVENLRSDLAWCEAHDELGHKHAYCILSNGTHRLLRGDLEITFRRES